MGELPKIDKEALKRDEKRTIVALKYILQTLEDRLKSGEIRKRSMKSLEKNILMSMYIYYFRVTQSQRLPRCWIWMKRR